MAALASTAVTVYPSGNNRYIGRDQSVVQLGLKLVLTGQGGQTNTIGAAALGFSRLISCSNLFDDSNNLVYGAVVDPVANVILLDAGNAGTPTDVTAAAAYITVSGNPAVAR